MKQKMIRCALLGAAALLAASCLGKGDYKNEYNTHIIVRFEPDADYQWEDFVDAFFDGGKDTVARAVSPSRGARMPMLRQTGSLPGSPSTTKTGAT